MSEEPSSSAGATAPPPPAPPSAPRGPRLHRSTTNRMLGGVAGGIGDTYGIDPVIVRVAFVVITWFGGLGLLLYLALWVLLPPADDTHPATAQRGPREPWFWIGLVLIALGVAAIGDRFFVFRGPMFWGAFWPLVLILGGIAVLVTRAHEPAPPGAPPPPAAPGAPAEPLPPPPPGAPASTSDSDTTEVSESVAPTLTAWQAPAPWPVTPTPWETPQALQPPAPPRRHEPSLLGPLTVSVLLIFAGTVSLVAIAGHAVDPAIMSAIALGAIGAALIVGAWFGRARGLIALGLLLTVVCAFFATLDVPVRGGIGARRYDPGSPAAVRDEYRLGIGNLHVDLLHVHWPRGSVQTVKVRVGIGRALVDVPSNVSLVLDGHSGAGAVNLTTRHTDGTSASDHVRIMRSEGTPVLHIDARVGIGQVEVLRPGDQADAGFLPPPKRKIIIEPNPSVRSLP